MGLSSRYCLFYPYISVVMDTVLVLLSWCVLILHGQLTLPLSYQVLSVEIPSPRETERARFTEALTASHKSHNHC